MTILAVMGKLYRGGIRPSKKYLLDYGGEELHKIGESLIEKQTAAIEDDPLRKATLKKLQEIAMGKRDLSF